MKVWSVFARTIALCVILFTSPDTAFAVTDVLTLDINGFRLGMTIDEVKAVRPGIAIEEVKPDGETVIGYRARDGEVVLLFTHDDLGAVLFHIQLTRVYATKQNTYPIFETFTKKYGKPDYSGRQMFNIQACWGKCYGKYRRLEFNIRIQTVVRKPFPMTLTLRDPAIEAKNRTHYKKLYSHKK